MVGRVLQCKRTARKSRLNQGSHTVHECRQSSCPRRWSRRGDRPAVQHGTTTVATYAELADRVSRLAGALSNALGLRVGDRVALAMTNCPEYVETLFAIWHAGLVAVPMNAKLHAMEFDFMLENAGARVCFITPDKARHAERRALGQIRPSATRGCWLGKLSPSAERRAPASCRTRS